MNSNPATESSLPTDSEAPNNGREFTTLEGFAFLISGLGVQFSSELFAQWGSFFYSPAPETGRIIYVPIALVSIIFVFGRAFDILIDPWIGSWSDRMSSAPGARRWIPIAGRRRPLIFWGSILMSVTSIAFWYPPVAGESVWNLIYGTIIMSAHWGFYALAYIPILALAPEIAQSQRERVRLGVWIAVGMTLGLVGAVILPGKLIEQLDPARAQAALAAAANATVRYSPVGYQRAAILLALISLASFQFFVWTVKERYVGEANATPPNFFLGMRQSLQSAVFRRYLFVFGLFYVGVLAMQRAAPYWVALGMGGDESTMTKLGIPYMATSLLTIFLCPPLVKKFGVKRLVVASIALVSLSLPFMLPIAQMNAPDATKILAAKVLYGVVGVGLGLIYVLATPLLGDIIDQDEREYGSRRDALFNALNAIMVKAGQILSIVLADSLMSVFGNSVSRPLGVFLVGPVGGAICVWALIAALSYPALKDQTIRKA